MGEFRSYRNPWDEIPPHLEGLHQELLERSAAHKAIAGSVVAAALAAKEERIAKDPSDLSDYAKKLADIQKPEASPVSMHESLVLPEGVACSMGAAFAFARLRGFGAATVIHSEMHR